MVSQTILYGCIGLVIVFAVALTYVLVHLGDVKDKYATALQVLDDVRGCIEGTEKRNAKALQPTSYGKEIAVKTRHLVKGRQEVINPIKGVLAKWKYTSP